MASLVTVRCKSCGKNHDFCLPDKDLVADQETYEYTCPESGSPAQITPPNWDKIVPVCPKGSVTVKKQPKQEA